MTDIRGHARIAARSPTWPISALRIGASYGTIGAVAGALASVGNRLPNAWPEMHGVELVKNLSYDPGGVRERRVDVYVPREPSLAPFSHGPWPVVVYVHGGGFAMLSKNTHRVMALSLSRMGFLTFVIDYRLGPRHLHPAPLEDAARALAWAKDNAASFGGDPTRIALAGESAGGNLVVALALACAMDRPEPYACILRERDIMPKAIVSTYGFHDLLDVHRIAREKKIAGWARRMIVEAAHSYVGPHVDDAVRAAPLSSPLTVLASDLPLARPLPPIFIDAGTKDPLMPHSRRLAAVLGKRGVPHEFHLAVGEIHGYDAMFWRRAAQNKWQRVGQFLRRHMGAAAAANGERREARAS